MPISLSSHRRSFGAVSLQEQNRLFGERPPHAVAAGGAWRGGHLLPPMHLASPTPDDHSWRQQAEARQVRDRLTDLLEEIGMPRTGGPLFEEDREDGEEIPEAGRSLPTDTDPYVVDESGHLYLTTWGGLYEKPSVLWEQRGGCSAQAFAVAALAGDRCSFSAEEVQP